MKITVICFTEKGFKTEKRLVRAFSAAGHQTMPFVLGTYALQAAAKDHEISFSAVRAGGLVPWAGEWFPKADALVFVGAAGIAVRAIAPFVKDKQTDPAVLVTDEGGNFVIPILSGHIGGANELAVTAARALGAQPVVTTATDINKKFSVDVFARKKGLVIDEIATAKSISADLLAGEPVGLFCDFPPGGAVPEGLFSNTMCRHNIWITISKKKGRLFSSDRMLRLIPSCVAVGIGCRRGTNKERIREALSEAMEKNRLDMRSICVFSSIDIKKEEAGIKELSRELGIPFLTYSREELLEVPGIYTDSAFVRQTTGIGNVCERAAMAACMEVSKNSRLLFRKWAGNGVTVAAAYFCPELFGEPEGGLL